MADATKLMNAKDAVYDALGSAYVKIDGIRYLLMQLKNIEATAKVDNKKVPIMGTTVSGNKPGTQSYEGKATIYANTSLFRKVLKKYQDTGEATYFDITCNNEDPTASVGKQTIILKDCLISQATLVKMEAGMIFRFLSVLLKCRRNTVCWTACSSKRKGKHKPWMLVYFWQKMQRK